jgi:hypothetical protein
MRVRGIRLVFLFLVIVVLVVSGYELICSGGSFLYNRFIRDRTSIAERLEQYGSTARARWAPYFASVGISYPPQSVVLAGLKHERRLEVYAKTDILPKLIRTYDILAASGTLGPKLLQGDQQVPEGIYGIDSLNPNSAFHLSLRINYPNREDRAQARLEGRERLGGDIMIHGNAVLSDV